MSPSDRGCPPRDQALAALGVLLAEAGSDEVRLLQVVADDLCGWTGDACVIRVLEPAGTLIAAAVAHPDPAMREQIRRTAIRTAPDAHGQVWRTLLGGSPVRRQLGAHEWIGGLTNAQRGFLRSVPATWMLGVPLAARGRVLGGILLVRCHDATPWPEDVVALLTEVGARTGLALDNARLWSAERDARLRAEAAEASLRAELAARARAEAQLRGSEEQVRRLELDVVDARLLRETNTLLEARTRELAAANQELEAFSYSVSHDLRAPLRVIDGFSEALLQEHADQLDGEARAFLARIRAASMRMQQLVDDMLTLSRATRGALARELVDVRGLALAVASELRSREPGRAVELSLPEGARICADPRLLRIVLENLLNNAWKFTRGRAPGRVAVAVRAVEGGAELTVQDNGAGFEASQAGRLFQPFQRLHRPDEFEGTGIGLAIVRRIVNRHGGRAWAEGEPDRGATVHIWLPGGGAGASDAPEGCAQTEV